MNTWLLLITSLPTENATLRMRVWRGLKASGAAVLRDGVYLMPEREACRMTFAGIAKEVRGGGGVAHLLRVEAADDANFGDCFDRSAEYADLLAEIAQAYAAVGADRVPASLKHARKLRKAFIALAEIDFFPGEAQAQADSALRQLESACARLQAPGEPHAIEGEIARLSPSDYRRRQWATRCRPWVDRLASAWLIRRFIDAEARFLWLARPEDCPPEALGFDFDGARFSHIGNRVTFEVLLASFALEQPALTRLGQLVHYLDVGGVQAAEAVGVESILAGLRAAIDDDDRLSAAASAVFDGLLTHFEKGSPHHEPN